MQFRVMKSAYHHLAVHVHSCPRPSLWSPTRHYSQIPSIEPEYPHLRWVGDYPPENFSDYARYSFEDITEKFPRLMVGGSYLQLCSRQIPFGNMPQSSLGYLGEAMKAVLDNGSIRAAHRDDIEAKIKNIIPVERLESEDSDEETVPPSTGQYYGVDIREQSVMAYLLEQIGIKHGRVCAIGYYNDYLKQFLGWMFEYSCIDLHHDVILSTSTNREQHLRSKIEAVMETLLPISESPLSSIKGVSDFAVTAGKDRKVVFIGEGKSKDDAAGGHGAGQVAIPILSHYLTKRVMISGMTMSPTKYLLVQLVREDDRLIFEYTVEDHTNDLMSFVKMLKFVRKVVQRGRREDHTVS